MGRKMTGSKMRKVGVLIVLGSLILAGAIWLALRKQPAKEHPILAPTVDDTARVIAPAEDSVSAEVLVTPRDTEPQPDPAATAGDTHSLSRNAADLYREAFAILQGLSEEERNLLWDLSTNAVPPELFAKLKLAVALLHQTTTNCVWGERVDRDTSQAFLIQYRELHKVLLWSAAHCRKDDPDGFRDDILAALRAGSNFAVHPFVQDQNTMLQGRILDFLAERGPSLPATTLAELSNSLIDGSYEMSFYRAMEAYAMNLESDAVNSRNTTPSGLAELQKNASGYYDWLINLQTSSVSDGMPIAEVSDISPKHWNEMVKWTQTLSVRRAMTAAALQVIASGPSALERYPDQSTGLPFQLQATENGFMLTSGTLLNGRQVTMNFRLPE